MVLGGGVFAQAAAAQGAEDLPPELEPPGYGPSGCKFESPGHFVSVVAQLGGHSDENNPGNAVDLVEPDVKTFCNPNPEQ